jgi:cell division protein FtsL
MTSTETVNEARSAGAALQVALLCCLLVILGSAVTVVFLAQKTRLLFGELESARKLQYELDSQWNRLILERSTLLAPANVERVARGKLGMSLPQPGDVVVVKP